MAIVIKRQKNCWVIPVKVTPKGGQDCFLPLTEADAALKIKVAAPPAKGEANTRVIHLLANALGLPKSVVAIVQGQTSRQKQVALNTDWLPEVLCQKLAGITQSPAAWFQISL